MILFALLLAIGLEGWTLLIKTWFVDGEDQIHRVHHLAWASLGGIIIVGGVLAQLSVAERKIARLQQIFVAIFALLIAMVLSGMADVYVLGAFTLGATALAVLHPTRSGLFARKANVSRPMLAISLVASIPLVRYALDLARIERITPVGDSHEGHWMMLAALSIAIIFVGALASLRTRGFRIPVRCAGAAAIVFGLASTVFPSDPGGVGRSWGLIAVAGGVTFVIAAEWESRTRGGAAAREIKLQGSHRFPNPSRCADPNADMR